MDIVDLIKERKFSNKSTKWTLLNNITFSIRVRQYTGESTNRLYFYKTKKNKKHKY